MPPCPLLPAAQAGQARDIARRQCLARIDLTADRPQPRIDHRPHRRRRTGHGSRSARDRARLDHGRVQGPQPSLRDIDSNRRHGIAEGDHVATHFRSPWLIAARTIASFCAEFGRRIAAIRARLVRRRRRCSWKSCRQIDAQRRRDPVHMLRIDQDITRAIGPLLDLQRHARQHLAQLARVDAQQLGGSAAARTQSGPAGAARGGAPAAAIS